MEIRKKIEKATALKELKEMKTKIVGENILDVLDSDEVLKEIDDVQAGDYLLAAVMSGIVYYDEDKKCLVQELINPVTSGEQTADILYYRNNLTLGVMREENTTNQFALTINLITRITGKTKQIIEKIYGQDLQVLQDIASFFYA